MADALTSAWDFELVEAQTSRARLLKDETQNDIAPTVPACDTFHREAENDSHSLPQT